MRLRSYVENCGFRELNQEGFLSKLPQRKSKGAKGSAYIHIALVVIASTIFNSFIF
ncbi:MAG TPA: hypothetical protein VIO64_07410 [Pseudobacteroides sp.]